MRGIERRLARLEAVQPSRPRWQVPIIETTDPDSPEHQARLAELRDEALRQGWRPEVDGVLVMTVVLPREHER